MNPNSSAFALILKQRVANGRVSQSNQWNVNNDSKSFKPKFENELYQNALTTQAPPSSVNVNCNSHGIPLPSCPPPVLRNSLPYPNMSFLNNMYASYPNAYQTVYQNTYQEPSKLLSSLPDANAAKGVFQYGQNGNQFHCKKASCLAPSSASTEQGWYCEPCDKDFNQLSSYNAHCFSHEMCKHPGCKFSATKKLVVAHFHGAHGQFSGSGYQMIDVEGQKFRVLLGTSPEEVNQWRNERKQKFPTAATALLNKEKDETIIAAGGLLSAQKSCNNSNMKKNRRIKNSHQCKEDIGDNNETGLKSLVNNNHDDTNLCQDGSNLVRCQQYATHGYCSIGANCSFSHDFQPKQCIYFKRGRCNKGEKCVNMHAELTGPDKRKTVEQYGVESGNSNNSDGNDDEMVSNDKTSSSGSSSKVAKKKRKSLSKLDKSCSTDDNNRKRKNTSGELYLPSPYAGGERGTLLKRLLQDEITAEENIILQCLRFIVQNNYFQPMAATAVFLSDNGNVYSNNINSSNISSTSDSKVDCRTNNAADNRKLQGSRIEDNSESNNVLLNTDDSGGDGSSKDTTITIPSQLATNHCSNDPVDMIRNCYDDDDDGDEGSVN